MAKVKIVLVLIIVFTTAIFFFWQKSSLWKNEFFFKKAPQQNQREQKQEQQSQGDSGYNPQGLIAGVRDTIDQIQKDSADKINSLIVEQKKEIAKHLLDEQQSKVLVTPILPTDTNQSQQKIIVIDLLRDTDLLFNIERGEKIYLTFKNARVGYCLYIDDTKYNIIEGQSLELEFITTGTFSLKTNLCDLNYSEHGQFIVE